LATGHLDHSSTCPAIAPSLIDLLLIDLSWTGRTVTGHPLTDLSWIDLSLIGHSWIGPSSIDAPKTVSTQSPRDIFRSIALTLRPYREMRNIP
jgi:hypothetical protein